MRKSTQREGSSFNPRKRLIFTSSSESWHCVKCRLLLNDSEFLTNEYNAELRIFRIRHELKHVSFPAERKREHTSFENKTQLNVVQLSLGPYYTMGETKDAPSKRINHMVPFNFE